MLEVRALSSHYGRIQALHGIDLVVHESERVALVGANGAGKTTLLRTISGVQAATGGSVRFAARDITRAPPDRRVRLGIGQVPEGRQMFGPMAVEDNLLLGGYTRSRSERAEDLAQVYERFPVLGERRRQPAGTLSGGEQQMLAIGRALMARPRLLLLDEPSMGLAPRIVEQIFAVIRELRCTILLVEQNAHAALGVADRGYVVESGRIVVEGPSRALLEDEQVQAAYLGL
ncbi:MAG TPA: ABC transporter ATP-binding protein [Geminicoccaceae bacterium]|nr:ABC transporter ATP-binding protein [Geminicoccaceae bacterium]